jgi:hypothetical protein
MLEQDGKPHFGPSFFSFPRTGSALFSQELGISRSPPCPRLNILTEVVKRMAPLFIAYNHRLQPLPFPFLSQSLSRSLSRSPPFPYGACPSLICVCVPADECVHECACPCTVHGKKMSASVPAVWRRVCGCGQVARNQPPPGAFSAGLQHLFLARGTGRYLWPEKLRATVRRAFLLLCITGFQPVEEIRGDGAISNLGCPDFPWWTLGVVQAMYLYQHVDVLPAGLQTGRRHVQCSRPCCLSARFACASMRADALQYAVHNP